MRNRTTHSDLAQLLRDIAAKLERIPAGYLVSDASTLKIINDAADIIVAQDRRIEEFTEAVRESSDPAMRKWLPRHKAAA